MDNNVASIISKEMIEKIVYDIRGKKVMLDYDLASIYGYTTKAFNQQVKRNFNKFPEDFMFRLDENEIKRISRSQFVTMEEQSDKRGHNFKYLPYAFTEQGIYMLMTILKGDLATAQSIALVRTFREMKNYITNANGLLMGNDIVKLVNQVNENTGKINKIEDSLNIVMKNFIAPNSYSHYLIMNGEQLKADIAYQQIYSFAKKSIIIVDDYIDIKTLQLLKIVNENIKITIITDNKARNSLNKNFIEDSGLNIVFKKNNGISHDRFIILDYNTKDERIFHSGCSSKDAGKKITAINEVFNKEVFDTIIKEML